MAKVIRQLDALYLFGTIGMEAVLKSDGTVLVATRGVIFLAKGYGIADPQSGAPCRVRTLSDIGRITEIRHGSTGD